MRAPKQGVDSLWREYTDFENSANANIAKKIIGEFSKTYNKARQITRTHEQKLKVPFTRPALASNGKPQTVNYLFSHECPFKTRSRLAFCETHLSG